MLLLRRRPGLVTSMSSPWRWPIVIEPEIFNSPEDIAYSPSPCITGTLSSQCSRVSCFSSGPVRPPPSTRRSVVLACTGTCRTSRPCMRSGERGCQRIFQNLHSGAQQMGHKKSTAFACLMHFERDRLEHVLLTHFVVNPYASLSDRTSVALCLFGCGRSVICANTWLTAR